MDPALLAVLQCPRCAGPLVAAGKNLECRKCQVDFPDLGGVPCLLPEPQRTVGDWRRESQRFLELIDDQVGTFDRELARNDLLASTRRRLDKLRTAYRDNGATVLGLFRDAGLAPDSRAKASGRDRSLILYYEQALRDWAWDVEGFAENQKAADLVSASLGDAHELGRVLVLGAGPSRLAYDLHQRFSPRLTVCLDLDPLLLLIANRVLFGGGVTLTEFPSDALSIDGVCVAHRLAAPAGPPARFSLLLADAFAPPLRPGSFDTVITPWFIDIVPADVRETIGLVHRLLAPGGRWLNYGPLSYPQEHRHGQRYSPDELVELIRASACSR